MGMGNDRSISTVESVNDFFDCAFWCAGEEPVVEGVCGDPEEEVEADDWGLEGSSSGTERCCR